MPELAEVEYYRKQWDPGIGKKVLAVECANPAARVFRDTDAPALADGVAGKKLLASECHGKQMLFRFGGGQWLILHLGMTGKMCVESPTFAPTRHDHLVFRQHNRALVFRDPRMFGKAVHHTDAAPPDEWRNLPPTVLSPAWSKPRLAAFLLRRRGAVLKPLLLEQDMFPGIGNWMADEILWRIGVDPARRAGALTEPESAALWRAVRRVSRQALDVIGTDWNPPPDAWLFNHRWRDGGTCPRCRRGLEREKIGGRTTCRCPRCQR